MEDNSDTSASDVFMPEAEKALLLKTYQTADIILEYGSGGSTVLAASLPDKYIMSVENDPDWAQNLVGKFEAKPPRSLPYIHVVDLGEVGKWGRPRSAEKYRDFPKYPLEIWETEFFRQPDAVLIDGRARTGCLFATMLRTKKPVTVLFDDYTTREAYQAVESIIKPTRTVGRMAVFDIKPYKLRTEHLLFIAQALVSVDVKPNRQKRHGLKHLFRGS